jgi:hypothetical protein
MTIPEIIAEIRAQIESIHSNHCAECWIGKKRLALDRAANELDQVSDSNEPSQSVTQRNTAKLQPKTAKAAAKKPKDVPPLQRPKVRTDTGATRQAILDYLREHPGSKPKDVAAAVGIKSTALWYHVTQLGKAVKSVGVSQAARYYLADQDPAETRPAQVDEEGDEIDYPELTCKICKTLCATKARLQQHMEMRHGRQLI